MYFRLKNWTEQVNMHCNYISNTWKVLLHEDKFPSLNIEGKYLE